MRRQRNTLTDWREIAWAARQRKKLGDTLRRAIETLSMKYREVLCLLRARMRAGDALASRLLPKPSEKNSDLANSYKHDISCKIQVLARQNSFSLA